jgi:hypothetical protein
LGLSDEQVAKVRTAAAVHDVGKISTPREVMNKPGKLTEEEYEVMKRHAIVGAAMAARINDPEITGMVRHHHEQLDGGGYPDGLSGSDIPLGARIIAVADTFDAITSARPYRAAQQHKRAMRILRRAAGTQLDPRAVEAFLGYYSGRRSVAGWSIVAAAPQKLGALLGSLVHTTGAASISQGVAAFGAAAAIAGGVTEAAVKHERDSHRAHGSDGVAAQMQRASYAGPTGGLLATDELRVLPETLPVDTQPVKGEKPRRHHADPKGADPGPVLRDTPEAEAAMPTGPKKGRDAVPDDSSSSPESGSAKKDPDTSTETPSKPGAGRGSQPPGQDKPKKPIAEPAPAPEPDKGKAPKLTK